MSSLLSVEADFVAESSLLSAHLIGKGKTCQLVLCKLSRLSILRRLVPSLVRHLKRVDRTHRFLSVSGLCLDVKVESSTIMKLGEGANPGLASRLLFPGGAEVRLMTLIGAILSPQRPPG